MDKTAQSCRFSDGLVLSYLLNTSVKSRWIANRTFEGVL